LLASALPATGANLLSVYDQALENDPQIREAEATLLADLEARPQAVAALLPSLSASANAGKSWSSSSGNSERLNVDRDTGVITVFSEPSNGSGSGNSKGWSLSLSQTLFSISTYMNLVTSKRQVAQAEVTYRYAQQQLVQRVAQQYFAVLQAQDNVRAQEAARDAYNRQFEQAEQRFDVGLYAITEVQEARAARDSAAANVIGAKRSLASVQEQLRATIGELPGSLDEPSDDMPLLTPEPASPDDWVKAALDQNLNLVSQSIAADIARDGVRSSYNGLVPSIGLSASKSFSDSSSGSDVVLRDPDTNDEIFRNRLGSNSKSNSKSIGLSFSMNLNGLGYGNQSRTTQAQHRWIAAKERLERATRDTERQARDAYLGVISDIARVQALRQALESSRTALTATEAGMEVGTRTIVDVLNQRQQLIQAETSYSSAKYQYLNDLITLQIAAGSLDRSLLEQINGWLTAPPAPAQ
jgi:outer membrane protein